MATKKCKTTITIDDLTDSIGVERTDKFLDRLTESDDSTYYYAYKEALQQAQAEGLEEEEAEAAAEEAAREAEEREQGEAADKWFDAVESAADELYQQHALKFTIPTKMVGKGKDRREVRMLDKIKVEPIGTWRDAATRIMETINGVGYFHFNSVKEFLDSGPYTACEAVMRHLHWIERYPDVYGTGKTAQRMVEDTMRYNNPTNRLVVTANSEHQARTRGRKFGEVIEVREVGPDKYWVYVNQRSGNPRVEEVELREIKKLPKPFTIVGEGEENIYFTDGTGRDYFFKHGGSEAQRSGFFKAIGVKPVRGNPSTNKLKSKLLR